LVEPFASKVQLGPGITLNNACQLLLFLSLYGAVLMTFASFALGAGGLHHDMTEAWAWGKEFQLGYAKHPPMSAWVAGIWFWVMPRSQWSFYLLSAVNVAAALVGVWMLAGLFLGTRGRWAAMLLLALTPSFNLWALKFNANAPLLSTWPWTTYFFLRSLQERRVGFALGTGVLGAIALLTKYYSVTLFGTLIMAAVLHPCCRRYFQSSAPYITLATGLLLMAPHIWWTMENGFPTIHYAISKTQYGVPEARASMVETVVASLCLLGIPLATYLIAFGAQASEPLRRSLSATFKKQNAWLVALGCGPLVLTVVAYLAANVRITIGFLMPDFFALPIVFLVLSRTEITQTALRKIALCVAAAWLFLALASPLFGYYALANAPEIQLEPRKEVAAAATDYWHTTFGQPLKFVAGEERLATATTFYSPDAPSYFNLGQPESSPWASVEEIKRDGLIFICPEKEQRCLEQATMFLGVRAPRLTRELTTSFFGRTAKPQRFVFFARPPMSESRSVN
jgi:4-amino-4-deoxy-L-arabinose transferase-like glycosyltransferase